MIPSSPGPTSDVTRIACGPAGTYGEQAAAALIELERSQIPSSAARDCAPLWISWRPEIAALLWFLLRIPLKGVTAILDALWTHRELCIRRALVLPIRHALESWNSEWDHGGLSHPQALAQCSGWLADHLPEALIADIVNGRSRQDGGWKPLPSRNRVDRRS